jgi:hypothetical protein
VTHLQKILLGSLVRSGIPRKCFIQLCIIFCTLEDEEHKLTEKKNLCTYPLFYALPKKKIKWASKEMIFPSEINGESRWNESKSVKRKIRERKFRSVNWQEALQLKRRKTNGRKTVAGRMVKTATLGIKFSFDLIGV